MIRPPTLTDAAIQSPPSEAADNAFQALLEALKPAGDDCIEAVRALPQHWRAVYTTYSLQCEVENGGHHQFFWNSEGALNKETEDDLRFIGATTFAAIFADARKVFENHDYPGEREKAGKDWEAFTQGYREKRLGAADDRFYAEEHTLFDILGEYIQSHQASYQ